MWKLWGFYFWDAFPQKFKCCLMLKETVGLSEKVREVHKCADLLCHLAKYDGV